MTPWLFLTLWPLFFYPLAHVFITLLPSTKANRKWHAGYGHGLCVQADLLDLQFYHSTGSEGGQVTGLLEASVAHCH